MKSYTQYGRLPRGRFELPGEAVEFVARQVRVPASELDGYEWSGLMHANTKLLQDILAEKKWQKKLTDADRRPCPRCSGRT
ncbi:MULTISPECIES: hypothetical protein [Streptomyces]|uniref:DUF4158 domain-containing protein n=1 Tax=Streptomyces alfalfae TaxID=1642299 RepID=A0ABN4VCH2_9ACTN|nr:MULTISPECIES: hypothetical protein [Streptomyces]APY84484.1 hypothetical protein A7J05_00625 [Streptomyces alfalfae]